MTQKKAERKKTTAKSDEIDQNVAEIEHRSSQKKEVSNEHEKLASPSPAIGRGEIGKIEQLSGGCESGKMKDALMSSTHRIDTRGKLTWNQPKVEEAKPKQTVHEWRRVGRRNRESTKVGKELSGSQDTKEGPANTTHVSELIKKGSTVEVNNLIQVEKSVNAVTLLTRNNYSILDIKEVAAGQSIGNKPNKTTNVSDEIVDPSIGELAEGSIMLNPNPDPNK
ncbi:OLC1v1036178C1 [Oldenlandia corymbosa var. corymbosa]|uniref:OLC1v1036178C1 n=1 Tax=Oldenlandia corymbosa var. corymbosa TaxID=529605 RepID=A0AAV1CUQ0_OLDCO|nr:OLC1v1036178C1 [Oldenlandia corymbosa var. corymbosa]